MNNVVYEYKDLSRLPSGLGLADAKIQAVKWGFAFQSEYAYLFNFFPCNIVYNDITLNRVSIFISTKVPVLQKTCSVLVISTAASPQAAERESFRVAKSPAWDRVKLDKMKTIVAMKFNQNPVLKNEILKTGEATLIEASHDTFWGAGLMLNPKKMRDGKWQGHNHFGKIMMNYRHEVRCSLPPPQLPPMIQNQCYRNYDVFEFQNVLLRQDWSHCYLTDDPEVAWSILFDYILRVADFYCPVQMCYIRKDVPKWFRRDLIEISHLRDSFFCEYRKPKINKNWRKQSLYETKQKLLWAKLKIHIFGMSLTRK